VFLFGKGKWRMTKTNCSLKGAGSAFTRRQFIKAAGVGAAAIAAGRCGLLRAAEAGKGRPNVVICIADDQGWRDAGCYGNPDVKTPNIDRIAGEGMRFDRAFTATAMCAPTRQQLYTGVFPIRNGAFPNHSRVYDGTRSVVHHLTGLGYRVGLAGKTHFGPRESFPFENVASKKVGEFIARDKNQPFCLVYASHSPHLAWSAGDSSVYDAAALTLSPDMIDTPAFRDALCRYYAEITDFDREVGEVAAAVKSAGADSDTMFICTSEQGPPLLHGKWTCYDGGLHVGFIVRWPRRVRAGSVAKAMVQYVDVTPTLVEAAGGDPTKIDTGLPGAPDGGRGFDGRSFLAVLEGKADKHDQYVFGVHTTKGIASGSECYPIRSIQSETHKYIRNLNHETPFKNLVTTSSNSKYEYWRSWVEKAKTDPAAAKAVRRYTHRPAEELYDLTKDPYELNNIAADPAPAKIKADLAQRLDAWMAQQGDKGNVTERQGKPRQGRGGQTKKPAAGDKPKQKPKKNPRKKKADKKNPQQQ